MKKSEFHLNAPPGLLADIKKLAKRTRRSMTAEIVVAIEKHVHQEYPKCKVCGKFADGHELPEDGGWGDRTGRYCKKHSE